MSNTNTAAALENFLAEHFGREELLEQMEQTPYAFGWGDLFGEGPTLWVSLSKKGEELDVWDEMNVPLSALPEALREAVTQVPPHELLGPALRELEVDERLVDFEDEWGVWWDESGDLVFTPLSHRVGEADIPARQVIESLVSEAKDRLHRWGECPSCYGSGGGPEARLACPACRGTGRINEGAVPEWLIGLANWKPARKKQAA